MNWRRPVYLSYASLRGYRFPSLLKDYLRQWESGRVDGAITTEALSRLLRHCREKVPYYAELPGEITDAEIDKNPREALDRLPLLTKKIIRSQFSALQSQDNDRRHCEVNTSGGSTGEPVRLIQDDDYREVSRATSLLSQHQHGCEVGQSNVLLWGSERDLERGTGSRKARFFNWLTNTTWLNAFNMSPARSRGYIEVLNQQRPRLIVAYAQAIYELARFAQRERISIESQRAVVTSAGTLYPFMRDAISKVFRCEVYNLYGSREVSDIAWELPERKGLWVAPWANFVEIVDEEGMPVPAGTEGNIVVTCLTNYAMPLVRYCIGDRGALLPGNEAGTSEQILKYVSGRNVDTFRTRDETLVDGEYFTHLLYFRGWVREFQVVQKSREHVVFKIVNANGKPPRHELDEIAARSRVVMGQDCKVDFEFVRELPCLPSGKFRYTISEVNA